jgi:hypothetical protein
MINPFDERFYFTSEPWKQLMHDYWNMSFITNQLVLIAVIVLIWAIATKGKRKAKGKPMTKQEYNQHVRTLVADSITDVIEKLVEDNKLTRYEAIRQYTKLSGYFGGDLRPHKPSDGNGLDKKPAPVRKLSDRGKLERIMKPRLYM